MPPPRSDGQDSAAQRLTPVVGVRRPNLDNIRCSILIVRTILFNPNNPKDQVIGAVMVYLLWSHCFEQAQSSTSREDIGRLSVWDFSFGGPSIGYRPQTRISQTLDGSEAPKSNSES